MRAGFVLEYDLRAWEDIQEEEEQLRLDDGQQRQLGEHVKRAQRDLRQAVWRTSRHIAPEGPPGLTDVPL